MAVFLARRNNQARYQPLPPKFVAGYRPLTPTDVTHSKGQYQFQSELGRGGFGRVIKARSVATQQVVAIKMIEAVPTFAEIFMSVSPEAIRKGLAEVKKLTELPHPNIVSFLQYYQYAEGRKRGIAIVMEHCSKGSLKQYLAQCAPQRKSIEKSLRFSWFMQLASALLFIHNHKIVHRDLKPDNILIGGDDNLKIADVGIATAAWEGQFIQISAVEQSFSSYMTTRAGTAPYIAPEVYTGRYTKECDVFSLGLVFWVMTAMPNSNIIPSSRIAQIWPGFSLPVQQYWLGQRLHTMPHCQYMKASQLNLQPSITSSQQSEINLFDKMLKYDYKQRPIMDDILKEIEKLKAEYLVGKQGSTF